ncbi:protein kinase [Streptomyces sp. NPDC008121]|uniref:protein kinase domain-containing protein n=1 Tax=Streptomyces sp. NPDC008121 TaxID=3364809 RepID=UPI0036F0E536
MKPLEPGDPTSVGDGRYQLTHRLGQGGMGVVYLGRSPSGRAVAVKVVRPELSTEPGFRRRFADEVAAARRVGGFHTASVVDADPEGDPAWLVTAFVPGPTLAAVLARVGSLPEDTLTVLAAGLAEALEAIHRAGVIHRDLKPANIIVAEDGPRVIDFGIARALDGTTLTRTGFQVGTPGFLSPEQLTRGTVTPAVDVFALGVVLAQAAGGSPFGDGPSAARLYQVVHEDPDLTAVPDALRELVADCLSKDPAARPTPTDCLRRLTVRHRDGGDWLPDAATALLPRRDPAPVDPRTPAAPEDARTPVAPQDPRASLAAAAPVRTGPPRPETARPGPVRQESEPAEPVPTENGAAGPVPTGHGAPAPKAMAPSGRSAAAPTVTVPTASASSVAERTVPGPAGNESVRVEAPRTDALPAEPVRTVDGPAGQRRTGRRRVGPVVVGVVVALATAGVLVWQPWYGQAGRSDKGAGTGGPSPSATPAPFPTQPMLIRQDTAPGWPGTCHGVIARRDPGADAPVRLIADDDTCSVLPQWSPDRRFIAYTRITPEGQAVWTARADGSEPRRRASIAGGRVSWSPDGTRLAVLRKANGVQQLFTIDLATGTAEQVTTGTARVEDPAWSPDGKRIAVCLEAGKGNWQIHVVDPAAPGTAPRQVTRLPHQALDPVWSPDGRSFAYTAGRYGKGSQGDIHVVAADGTGDRAVVATGVHEMDPTWSPDGAWLAFVRGPYEQPWIWAVRRDGTEPRSLTAGTTAEGHPNWR